MVVGSMRRGRMLLLLLLMLIAYRAKKSLQLSSARDTSTGLCLPRLPCEPTSGKRWGTSPSRPIKRNGL